MKTLNIGLLGISFGSSNYGCAALGYGFIELLDEVMCNAGTYAALTVFDSFSVEQYKLIQKPTHIDISFYTLGGNRKAIDRKKQVQYFNQFDYIFDFTAGDSFSDIYGVKRFISGSLVKLNVMNSKAKLILGNQTYGPFKHFISKMVAIKIINNAYDCFSRDSTSERYVLDLCKRELKHSTDVAFALPYDSSILEKRNDGVKRIGLNVSGLLWSGGYNRNNQFDLKCDYKLYTNELVKKLIELSDTEVYLIPHVCSNDLAYPDNDIIACKDLKEIYGDSLRFIYPHNAVEAKGYISQMDLFIGARMHATIAAFSAGIVTIPFAYSRKFEGLFKDLGYSHVIDGMRLNTDEAIRTTIELLENNAALKTDINHSRSIIKAELATYKENLNKLLFAEGD